MQSRVQPTLPYSATIANIPAAPRDVLRRRLAWALVILGVGFRLGAYLWNTGFWYDEGWLIQSLQDKSFLGLVGPLANDQAAPLLYLWLLKCLYLLGGLNESLLRAPSLLAAVGGMVLMWPLARRMVRPSAIIWALALLAASDNILIYCARTKPYAMDAMATMVLLYAAVRLKDASPTRAILTIGAIGAGLFWFSYPSCFVYGGVAIMLGLKVLRSRRRRDWVAFIAVNAIVAASMWGLMKLTASDLRTGMLVEYWGRRGFPMGFDRVMKWPLDATYRQFEEAMRPIGAFALVMSALGAAAMWRDRTRRFQLGLLVLPLLLNIAAGCLRRYPWVGGRLSMYNIPILVLLTAEGWAEVIAWLRRTRERAWLPRPVALRIAFTIGIVAVGVPIVLAVYHVAWVGHRSTHGRPLAMHVLKNAREGDRIVIAGANEFGIYFRGRCELPIAGGDYYSPPPHSVLDKSDWTRLWLLVRKRPKSLMAVAIPFLERYETVWADRRDTADLYLLAPPAEATP
ncbi:hypothetical protein LCGC14_0093740 [marine sediment metagenome]|uniref:Uncharacterized protein n=1 Tax=marine sediment metagenome TaxID=412755 RepID=A0A0F9VHC4_9ZZZZ|nr:hypothetical protein [Phycisphaerae bacterium]HDZ43546.1 hypothetical protein [Phycisphaerae bacterium]